MTCALEEAILILGSEENIMQQDKLKHLIAGVLVGASVGYIKPVYGVIAGTVVGIGKEIYDAETGRGTVEVADAVWTVVGSVLGAIIWII